MKAARPDIGQRSARAAALHAIGRRAAVAADVSRDFAFGPALIGFHDGVHDAPEEGTPGRARMVGGGRPGERTRAEERGGRHEVISYGETSTIPGASSNVLLS